ncbi:MAG: EAL domain-containing protein [Poseidonibacter sp.]|uniref:EAL domain-containing protein n=1 Tax=Poseidonibacter sp. TaxID=2321188 RepID=UPI00359EB6EF
MNIDELNDIIILSKKLNLIYIVKDNTNKDNKLDYFKSFFNNVICVDDGYKALKEFENQSFSIVITDIEIKGISGFDLIECFKNIDENIISIIYTNNEDKESFLKTIDLEIDGYLLKPFIENEFFKILYRSIKKSIIKKENKKIKKDLKLLKQYNEVIDKSTIISKTDTKGRITFANDNFCKVSEYSRNELLGKNHRIVRHPDNPKELYTDLWNTVKNKKQEWTGILKNLTKSGKPYYVKTTIKPILDSKGKIIEYIGVRDDISSIMSDRKHLNDKIDSTDLSLLILIQIEEFDILDKFYNISTVDKIEKMFGYNILTYLPNNFIFEHIYNLGSGQFALLTNFFDFFDANINLNKYLEHFIKNVKSSVLLIDEIEYDLNIVVSYSFGKDHLFEDAKCGLLQAINKKELIKYANDSSIKEHIEAKKNMEIIKMVKIALDNYKIISYFQPIINNKTKEIEKYESLVRLVDETGSVLSPFSFLDVSKKGTYYNKITHRVLENSFKILEHISTKISINLSSLDIEKEQTRIKLFELLEEYKDDASRVVFELLEDEEVKDFEIIKKFIKKVKAMGVQIAIDDFGAGYSSFERLLDFEPDILKIDGSLIKNIASDEYSKNVVETIVSFAKKQNIQTIAEYVENEEIYNILYDLGVDYSQGYYFGKPENININNSII